MIDDPTSKVVIQPTLFKSTAISAAELLERKIKPREKIIGTWLKQGDIGLVFGRRGEGKTFFSLALACAIAGNIKLNLWDTPKARRVCYVDGEMPLESIQDRLKLFLSADIFVNSQEALKINLYFQHYEEIAEKVENASLDLSKEEQQTELLKYCLDNKIEVLFLDNLSCLFRGVRENEADDWERVQPFLLNCRRNKISVILVAHAGRSGEAPRGTSKREDITDWIIKVKQSENGAEQSESNNIKQSSFKISFEKNREGHLDEVSPQGFIFTTQDGQMKIKFVKENIEEQFFGLVESGVNKCGELAEWLGYSKAYISRLANKYVKAGKLEIVGRSYKSKRIYNN